MRLNKFLAQATGISRRAADVAIVEGHIIVNNKPAKTGQLLSDTDTVIYQGKTLPRHQPHEHKTIMLNKPVGYVCSRNGQGSKTIYDLLAPEYHHLKPVGRLDKDSSGLLLLTTDGHLAHELTHPRFAKEKVYHITLNRTLGHPDQAKISHGIQVEDYTSRMELVRLAGDRTQWQVTLHQGRNRQIRRTFNAVGYEVVGLHRTQFGPYVLGALTPGCTQEASKD